MNNNEEQKLIMDVLEARSRVAWVKKEIATWQIKRNEAEKLEADAEAALIVYMQESGCVALESGIASASLKDAYSVDIASIDAVPAEYLRSKVVTEPDKVKIRNEAPRTANWFTLTAKPSLTIKMKS